MKPESIYKPKNKMMVEDFESPIEHKFEDDLSLNSEKASSKGSSIIGDLERQQVGRSITFGSEDHRESSPNAEISGRAVIPGRVFINDQQPAPTIVVEYMMTSPTEERMRSRSSSGHSRKTPIENTS